MVPCKFHVLSREEQVKLLYREAVYLAKRKNGTQIILLYQLEGFYVEVYYIKYRQYISRIDSFNSTEPLDPYLSDVDVEELINY